MRREDECRCGHERFRAAARGRDAEFIHLTVIVGAPAPSSSPAAEPMATDRAVDDPLKHAALPAGQGPAQPVPKGCCAPLTGGQPGPYTPPMHRAKATNVATLPER